MYSFVWLCMTMHDYAWLCMTMYDLVWLCMAMFVFVWLCTTMYDYLWLCLTMDDYVWLCMTMYDHVWLCMTLYKYVWLFMTMFDYVWLCLTMHDHERENFWRERERAQFWKLFRKRKRERERARERKIENFFILLQNLSRNLKFSYDYNILNLLILFNKPWLCLPLFTFAYLPLFPFVYLCSNDTSVHKLSQPQLNHNSNQKLAMTRKWLYTTTTHHPQTQWPDLNQTLKEGLWDQQQQ